MSGVVKRGKKYHAWWKGADGKQKTKAYGASKAAAERFAAVMEQKAVNVAHGVTDGRSEEYLTQNARPLLKHLEEWRDSIKHMGRTEKQADQQFMRASDLLANAGIDRISKINPLDIQRALAVMKAEGYAIQTINFYQQAAKQFSKWLWKPARRIPENLLEEMRGQNADAARVHARRPLTVEQCQKLITTAAASNIVRGNLSGRDRAMLYAVALATGFRAEELSVLTPSNFKLEAIPPIVTLAPNQTKNKKGAEQIIVGEMASKINPWLASKPPASPVFNLPKNLAKMLYDDLADAGIDAKAGGEFIDFHALRTTFATFLVDANVHPKITQRLMRHSSIAVTMRFYAKARDETTEAAVAKLPIFDIPTARPAQEAV